tara:strand:- start:775 stop:1314 length:540 start_codon:yes stop_codon:yes gene_type:complete
MGDGLNAFLIIIIFIILYNSCYFLRRLIDIKDNWNLYKCNPMVMPFAPLFNVDTTKNFHECVSTMQDKQMETKLISFKDVLKSQSNTNKQTVQSTKSITEMITTLTRNITNSFNKQYDYMGVFSTEIQKLTLTFKDILNKMIAFAESGVLFTKSGMFTGESIYNAYVVPISLGSLKKTR